MEKLVQSMGGWASKCSGCNREVRMIIICLLIFLWSSGHFSLVKCTAHPLPMYGTYCATNGSFWPAYITLTRFSKKAALQNHTTNLKMLISQQKILWMLYCLSVNEGKHCLKPPMIILFAVIAAIAEKR